MSQEINKQALEPAQNRMGTEPEGKLLFSMALPMTISMLFQALYNVVDSYFVAQLSQDAMNAVSLAFPMQSLLIAFSVGTGVGMSALISRSLGEKRPERAREIAGTGLFLFGVIILYGITGQLLMPQLTQMIQKVMADGTYHVPLFISAAMITAGLGIKSAMYPFHRWLPGAHGSATTTSSAVLSGLVLKGYAVLIITLFVRVFRMSTIRTLGVNYVVFFLGVAGMIIGSIYAIRESHIKRMLAYSSVAQLGYVFMGIGLATPAGIAAACYQILAHAFVKPMLFLSAGRLSSVTGHQKDLRILRGSAWRAPLAGVAFVVGALSMIGIPLLAGFSSKLNFALAEFHTTWETAMILTGLAVSTLLNALYYIPAVIGIWSDNESRNLYQFTPARDFTIAAVILMICVVALGVFFRPVMAVIEAGLALM